MSKKEVRKILKTVKILVKDLKIEINMRRVYIEKANGKWRPLGVPTKAWRVYLHMLNVLVVWFRTGSDPHQHAYKPHSGVHTAWQDLLERIDNPNIYEFDLDSFFPSVSLGGMRDILIQELCMPSIIAEYLIEINRSLTKLTKEDKLPEWRDRQVLLNTSGNPNPNLPEDIQRLLKEILELPNIPISKKEAALNRVLPEGWSVYKEFGVPQGSAISCGLATVNLHYIWRTLGDQLLMYADDGLVFPRNSQNVKVEDERRGITQNQSKSGWVKRNGEWLKSLKFLGLEYIPATVEEPSKIRAVTRNGSVKDYTLIQMFMVYLLNERDLLMLASGSPERTADSHHEDIRPQGENVTFVRTERGKTLLRELTYGGKMKSARRELSTKIVVGSEILKRILKDLSANVNIRTWIVNAADRFLTLPNPISQLFETHGLQILSKMFDSRKDSLIQAASEKKLTCTRHSWAYRDLGGMLYKKLHEFVPSEEMLCWINRQTLMRKDGTEYRSKHGSAESSSNWEIIKNNSRHYLEAWSNNFEMKDHTPLKFKTRSIGKVIEMEMRRWLRGLTLNIQNVSTYAVEDLLDSGLFLNNRTFSDASRIKFSKMNRVQLGSSSEEELLKRGKRMAKKLDREFYKQFGKHIENLPIKSH